MGLRRGYELVIWSSLPDIIGVRGGISLLGGVRIEFVTVKRQIN